MALKGFDFEAKRWLKILPLCQKCNEILSEYHLIDKDNYHKIRKECYSWWEEITLKGGIQFLCKDCLFERKLSE